jgi:hypothetical protein
MLPAFIFGLTVHLAHAGSATWKLNPVNDDWNNTANWTPATVPNGPSDVATFASSNQTAVTISANAEVAQIVFGPGASSYSITLAPAAMPGLISISEVR